MTHLLLPVVVLPTKERRSDSVSQGYGVVGFMGQTLALYHSSCKSEQRQLPRIGRYTWEGRVIKSIREDAGETESPTPKAWKPCPTGRELFLGQRLPQCGLSEALRGPATAAPTVHPLILQLDGSPDRRKHSAQEEIQASACFPSAWELLKML